MEKTITALFDTTEGLEAAKTAARAEGAQPDKMSVCRAKEQPSVSGKNTLFGAAAGAAAGAVLGIGATMLENMGIISSVGPLTGLISGTVAGAIIGGFMDFEAAGEEPPERWLFTVSIDEENTGSAARRLKRCGGDKVSVN